MAKRQISEYQVNPKDPRNSTYWAANGSKVLRSWPVSDTQIELHDVVTGASEVFSNAEITLMVNKGELIEVDPFQTIRLPTGGKTPARLTNPEKEASLVGKYAKPETLAGKYSKGKNNVSVVKRAIDEGIKINDQRGLAGRPGATRPAGTGPLGTAMGAPASGSDRGEAVAVPGEAPAVPAVPTNLVGKYAKKAKQ